MWTLGYGWATFVPALDAPKFSKDLCENFATKFSEEFVINSWLALDALKFSKDLCGKFATKFSEEIVNNSD